jgi:hypothetical protein
MLSKRKPLSHRFVSALILLAVPMAAHSLSLGVGPIGGINFGNAAVDNHDETDMRTGLALGGRAEFGVTSPYSLLVEAMYVQKGARFDVSAGPFGSIRAQGDLDYLEIPLLIKAKFGKQGAHAYLFAGPSMGINLNTEGKFGSLSDTFKDEAASLTFSGDIGLGAAFRVQRYVYLTADVRYSHGFSDALDESVGDIDSWKSRDVRALAGVLIHLSE